MQSHSPSAGPKKVGAFLFAHLVSQLVLFEIKVFLFLPPPSFLVLRAMPVVRDMAPKSDRG